jgi:hypothetical protein
MLYTVPLGNLSQLGPDALSDELERARIVYFPECPVNLPSSQDLAFLREELARHVVRKNISYYRDGDRLTGLDAQADLVERTRAILRAYGASVEKFLARTMPNFFRGCRTGTTSFRPFEEQGRALKPHASNELVHVDAGAYGATHGDRVLRFFTNVHPQKERVWVSKGSFPELYRRYGKAAGVEPKNSADVEERSWDKAYSRLIGLAATRVTAFKVIDSSPYDRLMRRFHNFMKDTAAFQQDPTGHQQFAFKPFSSWMVLTDAVSHACISGQHAFADTFIVPLQNCRLREQAPFELLKAAAR